MSPKSKLSIRKSKALRKASSSKNKKPSPSPSSARVRQPESNIAMSNVTVTCQSIPLKLRLKSKPNSRNPSGYSGRRYSNTEIETRIFELFDQAIPIQTSMSLLSSGPCSVRPYKDFNVKKISKAIEKGSRGHDAVAVWNNKKKYRCIYGNQKFLAQQRAGGRFVTCYVIDDKMSPKQEDLEYAAMICQRYSPQHSPQSFISNVIEVRTIMKWLLKRGVQLGSIDVGQIKKYLPPMPDSKEHPTIEHWSHGKWSSDMISKVLHVAKVFMHGDMEAVLDDIERTCFQPFKQVSRSSLVKVKTFEQLKKGAGKRVLERYLEDLNKPCASKDQNKNKKIRLDRSAQEMVEFGRLIERENQQLRRNNEASHSDGSHGNELSQKQAIKQVEKGLGLVYHGLSILEKSPMCDKHCLQDAKKASQTA